MKHKGMIEAYAQALSIEEPWYSFCVIGYVKVNEFQWHTFQKISSLN